MLVTGRYPYAAPVLATRREPEPESSSTSRPAASIGDAVLRTALVALARRGARRSRAYLLYPDRRSRPTSRSGRSTSTTVFGAELVDAREAVRARSSTSTGCSRRSRSSRRSGSTRSRGAALRAGVGRRADRHGDAPRHARARDRLARAAPVRGSLGALVGSAATTSDGPRLPRLGSSTDWVDARRRVLSICVALLIVMGLARRLGEPLVDSRRGRVRRRIAACFAFVAPYLDSTTSRSKDRALLAAATRATSGSRALGHIPISRRGA